MCGIAGIWNRDGAPVDERELRAMTSLLRHRGPDGEGVYVDGALGLGHRRLAILDLSPSGHQPMPYASGRYWIVFNGEIYNFIELKEELSRCGHVFRSESDTEVIAAAYVEWGQDCQLRFNGMWAFAIWDCEKRELFLSRDRFGVKPLHYYFDGKRFAFASEMKAFLPLPWFSGEFDAATVARALHDPSTIEATEDCLLKGLKRLKGGNSILLAQDRRPVIRRWWHTLEHLTPPPRRIEEQAQLFKALFLDACNIRMRSDVPIGTALSGGLDSSSVLCSMAHLKASGRRIERHSSDWQKAVIATFPGTEQDEREYAEAAVAHAKADALFREMKSEEVAECLDAVLFHFEEIYDLPSSAWLTYRELRRAGVVVSLDGHGGDELLAGYHHYPPIALRDAESLPYGAAERTKDLRVAEAMLNRDRLPSAPTLPVDARTWLRTAPGDFHLPELADDQYVLSGVDALTRRLHFDFHYYTLPTILRNFDRCSMAHGVEIRAPFMDWRLVTFAFSLPSMSKIGEGYTKYILRLALAAVLPEKILRRTTKLGFVSPLASWVSGPLKPFLLDVVTSRAFHECDMWNGPAIRDYVERSYASGMPTGVVSAWKYVHAFRLMEVFRGLRKGDQSTSSAARIACAPTGCSAADLGNLYRGFRREAL